MQTFIDTSNQKIWQFEDDVLATDANGAYVFVTAHEMILNTPKTLKPHTIPAPTEDQLNRERIAISNADIKHKIIVLEASQARAMREAVLGKADAVQKLHEIDAQIVSLRDQLQ